jgi:hypothetical protein
VNGKEYPCHDGIGKDSVVVNRNGRRGFVYAAKDGDAWKMIRAFPDGKEVTLYSGLEAVIQTSHFDVDVDGDSYYGRDDRISAAVFSADDRVAFVGVQKGRQGDTVSVIHYDEVTNQTENGDLSRSAVVDQGYHYIESIWWSPHGDLLYRASNDRRGILRHWQIVLNGREVTQREAKNTLVPQFGHPSLRKEVIEWLEE